MSTQDDRNVFVVVEVMAGAAVGAECFDTQELAARYAESVRNEQDDNDDDTQVFETAIKSTL